MDKVIRGSQEAMVLMEPEYWRVLVATSNGQPAGIIQLNYHGSKEPRGVGDAYVNYLGCWASCRVTFTGSLAHHTCKRGECYIDHICCDAQFRGQGIGKKLMEAAEAQARDQGCTFISLHVAAENRAKNLYERQGYQVTETVDSCWANRAVGRSKFYKMEKQL